MRTIASCAALSGALALTALSVPAAQADTVVGDTTVSNIVVNGGKDVVIGTTNKVTFKVTFTASDPSGIEDGESYLYKGTWSDPSAFWSDDSDEDTTCAAGTKVTCTTTYTIVPEYDLYGDASAGAWRAGAYAKAVDGNSAKKTNLGGFSLKRYAKLTVNASPEPVTKGKAITVAGKLTRASWNDRAYHGYTGQPVKLQFRKAGSSSYSTVKTVPTNSHGDLKTTVTAASDGYWRYYFPGTSTTAPATVTGDFVDVK
ncbi:calcium-binding protein [Streptomyces sp. NPDC005236]|uniref:calcium-binding protein n=1 Tax=Streptomyces sp. NPDC005236 TaxID=3157028 RepID=UPI0033A8EE0B